MRRHRTEAVRDHGEQVADPRVAQSYESNYEAFGRTLEKLTEYVPKSDIVGVRAAGAETARLVRGGIPADLSNSVVGRFEVLSLEANRLAPFGTTYTWVPRELNKHADRLANEALDGNRSGVTLPLDDEDRVDDGAASLVEEVESPTRRPRTSEEVAGYRGWSPPEGPVTTLVLVRHGATSHTADKLFSGGLASSNPGLSRNNPLERHYRDVLCARIHTPQNDPVLGNLGRAAFAVASTVSTACAASTAHEAAPSSTEEHT